VGATYTESSVSQSARTTAAPTPIGSHKCLADLTLSPRNTCSPYNTIRTLLARYCAKGSKLLRNPINDQRLFSPQRNELRKFTLYTYIYVIRDKALGIATDYWLGDRGVEFESRWGQEFSLLHVVQTGSGVHLTPYPMGTGGSFPGGKAAWA
jgi:hypothetical protein